MALPRCSNELNRLLYQNALNISKQQDVILCIKHRTDVVYQVCFNDAPGIKMYIEKRKQSLKPHVQNILCLVFNIA